MTDGVVHSSIYSLSKLKACYCDAILNILLFGRCSTFSDPIALSLPCRIASFSDGPIKLN